MFARVFSFQLAYNKFKNRFTKFITPHIDILKRGFNIFSYIMLMHNF